MASQDLIPWWGWLLLWVALGLAAIGVLAALAWGLVKQGIAVVAEAGTAGERAGQLLSQVESFPVAPRQPPAVLDEPARLRRERADRLRLQRRVRARAVAARRAAARSRESAGVPANPG